MKDVTKTMLDALEDVTHAIQRFHGLRHLWADAVANHVEFVSEKDELMNYQRRALHQVVYMALRLYDEMIPDATGTPHSHYFKLVPVDASTSHPPCGLTVMFEVSRSVKHDDGSVEVDHVWLAGHWDRGSYWGDRQSSQRHDSTDVRRWCFLPELPTWID